MLPTALHVRTVRVMAARASSKLEREVRPDKAVAAWPVPGAQVARWTRETMNPAMVKAVVVEWQTLPRQTASP